jgi:hypothetical protein
MLEEEKGMVVFTWCTECGRRADYCTCNDGDYLEDEE